MCLKDLQIILDIYLYSLWNQCRLFLFINYSIWFYIKLPCNLEQKSYKRAFMNKDVFLKYLRNSFKFSMPSPASSLKHIRSIVNVSHIFTWTNIILQVFFFLLTGLCHSLTLMNKMSNRITSSNNIFLTLHY